MWSDPSPREALVSVRPYWLYLCLFSGVALLTLSCRTGPVAEGRPYLAERFNGHATAHLYADGFEDLSLQEKVLSYHLYMAAIAGGPIAYDQNNQHHLSIKGLMEYLVGNQGKLPADLQEPILTYAKLVWIHHGNHHARTTKKFLPPFTYEDLKRAISAAGGDQALLNLADRLRQAMFDPTFQSAVTVKSPPPGEDIITASANNFYEGVTLEEVERFYERYPLNSKVVKEDGKLREVAYRAGGDGVPPGLYAAYLTEAIKHLEAALPYAEPKHREALERLIRYFRTGEPQAFREYNIAWVQSDPTVDTINGFIEVYKDARGQKGEYEGLVYFRDVETTVLMKGLADRAEAFEEKMPWEDRFKRRGFTPPVSNAVTVLMETGGAGPISWSGINLPNAQDIRETYGSKSILLTNAIRARRQVVGGRLAEEFATTEEERQAIHRYGSGASDLLVAMHEVLGHASGKVSPDLPGDPADHLKEYYSTLEEARADLVALWHIWDSALAELGVQDLEAVAREAYRDYLRDDLIQLRRMAQGEELEEDHMRGTHMIVNFLRERGAADLISRDGKHYLIVMDFDKMRDGVGVLLAELMRIKATGDYEAIKTLVEDYGIRFDPTLRDEVLRRVEELGLPVEVAFIMPKLTPEYDADGRIQDVTITYPDDFAAQMLWFSELEAPVNVLAGTPRLTTTASP